MALANLLTKDGNIILEAPAAPSFTTNALVLDDGADNITLTAAGGKFLATSGAATGRVWSELLQPVKMAVNPALPPAPQPFGPGGGGGAVAPLTLCTFANTNGHNYFSVQGTLTANVSAAAATGYKLYLATTTAGQADPNFTLVSTSGNLAGGAVTWTVNATGMVANGTPAPANVYLVLWANSGAQLNNSGPIAWSGTCIFQSQAVLRA